MSLLERDLRTSRRAILNFHSTQRDFGQVIAIHMGRNPRKRSTKLDQVVERTGQGS